MILLLNREEPGTDIIESVKKMIYAGTYPKAWGTQPSMEVRPICNGWKQVHLGFYKYVVFFLFIGFVCIVSPCKSDVTFACQDCWGAEKTDSGKAPHCDRELSYYIDSIPSYANSSSVDWFLKTMGNKSAEVFSLSIDTIGLLNGGQVIDLIYKIGSPERYLIGKSILHEAFKDRYHLLYVFVNMMGEFFPARSQLFHVDSHEILSTKSRLGGQMSMYSKAHWTWNSALDSPCRLNFGFSVDEQFAQDIKKEFKTSWIGSLDLDSLYVWAYVELPGDHYRWPTGGRIWVKLAIEDCEFVVIDKGYDSTDIASH